MTLTQYIKHLEEQISTAEQIVAIRGNTDVVDEYDMPPLREVIYNAETDRCLVA